MQIKSLSFGRLALVSKIKAAAKNVIRDSCNGKLTANIFLGNAGVGKSTIAGLISTFPGIFQVGRTSAGTTTLGTWISSSLFMDEYSNLAIQKFGKNPALSDSENPCGNCSQPEQPLNNLLFMDTEGLGFQTEYGKNYDVVTILPNMLIAENVFLVVNSRLRPNDVKNLFDRFGEAAGATKGLLPFRKKLFGNLVIIINQAQQWMEPEEEILSNLKRIVFKIFVKVTKYFIIHEQC